MPCLELFSGLDWLPRFDPCMHLGCDFWLPLNKYCQTLSLFLWASNSTFGEIYMFLAWIISVALLALSSVHMDVFTWSLRTCGCCVQRERSSASVCVFIYIYMCVYILTLDYVDPIHPYSNNGQFCYNSCEKLHIIYYCLSKQMC